MQEPNPLVCPFCGAPYRNYISPDTVQVVCQYCRGIFFVKPKMEKHQCTNHPGRLSLGLCNDCGRSFCGGCLRRYMDGRYNVFYLCPSCLKERCVNYYDGWIIVGIIFIICGVFVSLFLPLMGIVFIIMAIVSIIFVRSRKKAKLKELATMEELLSSP